MQLLPKLQPFWFEPPFQDKDQAVKFRLRPLTQSEMIECEELYHENADGARSWTRPAQYRAGMMSIVACDNIFDVDGKPVQWKRGIGIPDDAGNPLQVVRDLVVLCGMRIITEMNGGDWNELVKDTDSRAEAAASTQPAETDSAKT